MLTETECLFGSFNFDFYSEHINREYILRFIPTGEVRQTFVARIESLTKESALIESSVLDTSASCFARLCPCAF
jgi:hypothetical protein